MNDHWRLDTHILAAVSENIFVAPDAFLEGWIRIDRVLTKRLDFYSMMIRH